MPYQEKGEPRRSRLSGFPAAPYTNPSMTKQMRETLLQDFSGLSEWSEHAHRLGDEEVDAAKSKIRPNVQEVVGVAWAEYQLHGTGTASVVDWIAEALTDRLARDPEFFWGGEE